MAVAQHPGTACAFRPRLSAVVAVGALGLGLLIAPAGTATADPPNCPTTSASTWMMFISKANSSNKYREIPTGIDTVRRAGWRLTALL